MLKFYSSPPCGICHALSVSSHACSQRQPAYVNRPSRASLAMPGISQKVTRAVSGLLQARPTATKLNLERFAHPAGGVATAVPIKSEQRFDDSGSELSAPPSSPENVKPVTSTPAASRKRKRNAASGSATLAAPDVNEVRRSPRKAPKLEPLSDNDDDENEDDDYHDTDNDNVDQKPKPSMRRPRRQPAKPIKAEDGSIVATEPPPRWEEMYTVTTALRKRHLAPADTMGCESLAEGTRPPLERRLQTLVALMLSSQTKDTVTAVAMKNLQANIPGGFTLDGLLRIDQQDLNELISKVGFHNNKARFIKQTAEILRDRFKGDIPDTIEGLTSLPGVGPKMAYLTMSAAWGRDEGIGVDVHVHRITNLWGWHKTSTPEQTRMALEAWLPREKWHDINHLLVGLGQTICLPIGRRCGECDLSIKKLCPSAVPGSPVKRKVKKEIKVEVKEEEDQPDVTTETVTVEQDDATTAVHIKSEDLGEVELEARAGSIPDIEGVGAGLLRKRSPRPRRTR